MQSKHHKKFPAIDRVIFFNNGLCAGYQSGNERLTGLEWLRGCWPDHDNGIAYPDGPALPHPRGHAAVSAQGVVTPRSQRSFHLGARMALAIHLRVRMMFSFLSNSFRLVSGIEIGLLYFSKKS